MVDRGVLTSAVWRVAFAIVTLGCGGAGMGDANDLDAPTNDGAAIDVVRVDGGNDTGNDPTSDVRLGDDIAADAVGDAADAENVDAGMSATHRCGSFVDRSATSADRTIQFAPYAYTPSCVDIAPGQQIRFTGDFAMHQLRSGIAPSRAAIDPMGSTPNPIAATDVGLAATFTFPAAGVFPFYCLDHEGTGMYGVVRVR